MEPFTRVVRPGFEGAHPIYCKIEWGHGRLSVTGVVGPRSMGRSYGGCGQIIMSFREYDSRGHMSVDEIVPADGWSPETVRRFFDAWHKWHLNDMRANCEHQTGPEWDGARELTLYYWRLRDDALKVISDARAAAVDCIKRGESFTPTAEQTRIINLPDRISTDKDEPPTTDYVANGPQYDKDHYNRPSEVKTAGWVRPGEHPGGLLRKPCPVCGYEYGSAWKREAVPEEVLAFLTSLPEVTGAAVPIWV